MKIFNTLFVSCAIIIIFLFFGCQSESDKHNLEQKLAETLSDTSETTRKVITIFYNLPTPIEMSQMVKQTKATFYPEILNPLKNIGNYTTNDVLAMNLGIYGVDLGYLKFFDQTQEALNYLQAISKISGKLGLPSDKGDKIYGSFEKNVDDKDTQIRLLAEVYADADKYLKENERQNIAIYMLIGGWIEGLYISTQIYQKDPKNHDVLNRIAEQKYSLNTMIELVSNYKDNVTFADYFGKLLMLKKVYEKIEINFQNSNPNIDTINKVIVITGENSIQITDNQVNDISRIVSYIRNNITN